MGLRVRRSFKVAPGMKINLGKKSAGVSFGGKGGGISFNTRSGARARVSIPGTGISYSTKLGGKTKRRKSSSSRSAKTVQQHQQAQNTSYIKKMQKSQSMAQKYNLTADSAAHKQMLFILSTIALFVLGVLTNAYTICAFFLIAGCVTWYYAVQFGRTKNYLKQNSGYNNSYPPAGTSETNSVNYTSAPTTGNIPSLAEQNLKIIEDCIRLVNTTKNPDTYFKRYELMESKIDELIPIRGVKYQGMTPMDLKQQAIQKKQSSIHDMIDRYFNETTNQAQSLKTDSGKRNKYHHFISTLEDYYDFMDQSNIQYVQMLYNNAITSIDRGHTGRERC